MSQLADVLGRPLTGVTRIVLEHHRCQVFRPIAILEYTLGLLCLLCLLPLLIVALLFTEADVDLPNFKTRFYRRWHQLRLVALDSAGNVLWHVDHVPNNEDEGQAAVASILDAAMREQVVLSELIVNGSVRTAMETWYGGQPLLAHPNEVNEAASGAVLESAGLVVQRQPGAVLVAEESPPLSGAKRVVGWLLVPLVLPFVPLLLLSQTGKRALRFGWQDLRGVGERSRVVVEVRAESLRSYWERSGETWNEALLDGRTLLGITFSPTLGYDADVTLRAATLRCIGRQGSSALPLQRAASVQSALRDFLVAATLRLRAERPELGLLGSAAATRCPFCSALFVMTPGARCPSCGAHAGTTP
ncbi:MAG: hypothetical protein R3B13_34450 [Polyangiaceae bacterium]